MPPTLDSLSLVGNTFHQDGEELAQAFSSLDPNLSTLDLYFTELSGLSLETLKQLNNSLPYLKTIYLDYDEMVDMGPEKVRLLHDAFPNIENINIIGSPADTTDLFVKTNLLRTLGFNTPTPSLLNVSAFFVKRSFNMTDLACLPQELQTRVNAIR
ncbi:hypothetical protein [Legionella feeleii]|uniref:Leucine-rich repeat-containing protein n=1 Tax=Legionella feeleii TaxID=453 RepID=A0A378IPW9_9GAMM|nr:hypothetical protein [Legionella feeleii]STX37278.1 leucine-rich repeat-containing protein [Legionella feeleii]